MKFLKFYHLSEPPQQASLRHDGDGCQDVRTASSGGHDSPCGRSVS